jgi:hypothetical protein
MKTNAEKGREWEELVRDIVNGKRMPPWFQYDIESASGEKLEVKGSSLRLYGDSLLPKWHWSSLLGRGRQDKKYDRLILVGDDDEGPTSRTYSYFDLPYWWVLAYVKRHNDTIACPKYLSAKPGIGVELHQEFKVNEEQLFALYGARSTSESPV